MALKVVRRHRLWEQFLAEHLGYPVDRIHEEAERLEHATSDELERRLDRILGHPSVDPHGDPIPTGRGVGMRRGLIALAQCRIGDRMKIRRVSRRNPSVARRAAEAGLQRSVSVRVKKRGRRGGYLVVEVGEHERRLGPDLATAVLVERC